MWCLWYTAHNVHRLSVIDPARAKNYFSYYNPLSSATKGGWVGGNVMYALFFCTHTINQNSPKQQQSTTHPNSSISHPQMICMPISLLQQWYRSPLPGLSKRLRSVGHGLEGIGCVIVLLGARWESGPPLTLGVVPMRLAFLDFVWWGEWESRSLWQLYCMRDMGFPKKAKRANNDVDCRDRNWWAAIVDWGCIHRVEIYKGGRATLVDRYHENWEGTTAVRMERGMGRKWKLFHVETPP